LEKNAESPVIRVSSSLSGLAHGSSILSPHADAPFGRRDQSLSPNGELRPHALRSCYSFEPSALACRSRFVVAKRNLKIEVHRHPKPTTN
jgi:hypothetical protein